jgi:ATP-binding cassette subfamily B protein
MAGGDVLSCITRDVQQLCLTISNSLPNLVSSGAQIVGCMVMMFATEWRLGLWAVGASVLSFGWIIQSRRGSRRCFLARQAAVEMLNGYVEEVYTGHDVVRLSRAGRQVKEKFRELNGAMYSAERRGVDITMPMTLFAGNLGYVAVCVCGAVLAVNGVIGFGDIVALIIYVWLFSASLNCLWRCMAQLQEGAAAGVRIVTFLSEETTR